MLHRSILVLVSVFATASCGINLYEGFVSKEGDDYHLTEAERLIDEGDYTSARQHLAEVELSSNKKLYLDVAAQIGEVGLSLWDILIDLVDNNSLESQSGSGVDRVFDLLTDNVYGTGETRDKRLNALGTAVERLASPPNGEEKKIENLRCFLSGMLVLPRVKDGTTAITEATTALENFVDTIVGTGDDPSQCPNLNTLTTTLNQVTEIQADLQLALEQIEGCDFLQVGNDDSLNAIEEQLSKFRTSADKGCATIDCAGNIACEVLQTGCVRQTLEGAESAVAGDNKIDACEVLQHCRGGECF